MPRHTILVRVGLGSELEKTRFGAKPVPRVMYVQSHDRFHHDVLELIASDPQLVGRNAPREQAVASPPA